VAVTRGRQSERETERKREREGRGRRRADNQSPAMRRGPGLFLTGPAERRRQVRAGPPSGNTTVPYRDSRLLPSHAPPVVTARFEVPSSSFAASPPPPTSAPLPLGRVFLRPTNGFGAVPDDRDGARMTASISIRPYVNNCRHEDTRQAYFPVRYKVHRGRARVRARSIIRDWPIGASD